MEIVDNKTAFINHVYRSTVDFYTVICVVVQFQDRSKHIGFTMTLVSHHREDKSFPYNIVTTCMYPWDHNLLHCLIGNHFQTVNPLQPIENSLKKHESLYKVLTPSIKPSISILMSLWKTRTPYGGRHWPVKS